MRLNINIDNKRHLFTFMPLINQKEKHVYDFRRIHYSPQKTMIHHPMSSNQ